MGDAVVFAKDSVHRTQELIDRRFRRYAIVGRFVDIEATYLEHTTSFLTADQYRVMHDMCDHRLKSGNHFSGPCFPRIFPEVNYVEADAVRRYVRPTLIALMGMFQQFCMEVTLHQPRARLGASLDCGHEWASAIQQFWHGGDIAPTQCKASLRLVEVL